MKKVLQFLLFVVCLSAFAQKPYTEKGEASYYNDKYNGAKTANGELYSSKKYTAAHRTLPFGTILKVTNPENQATVEVRVNDRGPNKKTGRLIDLSRAAAEDLGVIKKGIAQVIITEVNLNATEEETKELASEEKEVIATEKEETIAAAVEEAVADEKTTDIVKGQEIKEVFIGNVVKDVVKDKVENIKEITNSFKDSNAIEYYILDSKKVNTTGFGVQIGSYKEMVNLMELSTKLKESLGYAVHVQVLKNEAGKYYKISLGNFKTKEKAISAKEKIKDTFPDCFIMKYYNI